MLPSSGLGIGKASDVDQMLKYGLCVMSGVAGTLCCARLQLTRTTSPRPPTHSFPSFLILQSHGLSNICQKFSRVTICRKRFEVEPVTRPNDGALK